MKYYPKQRKVKRPGRFKYSFRKYQKLLKVTVYVLISVGLLLGVIKYANNNNLLKVKSVEVTGAKNFVNPQDITEVVTSLLEGKSLLTLSTKNVSESLKSTFQGAKEIYVTKKLPSTIKVLVTERMPLAIIYTSTSSEYYLVDEDGYVLGIVDPHTTNLPKILYSGDIKVGYFLDRDLVPSYIELVSAVDGGGVKVSSMSFYDRYASLFIQDGVEVLVSNSADKKTAVEIIRSVLDFTSSDGNKIKKIDLRYDKVIVSYE